MAELLMTWRAIIEVNVTDEPHRQARDIEEGIVYACALLMDVYGWSAEQIRHMLERATDVAADQEDMNSQASTR